MSPMSRPAGETRQHLSAWKLGSLTAQHRAEGTLVFMNNQGGLGEGSVVKGPVSLRKPDDPGSSPRTHMMLSNSTQHTVLQCTQPPNTKHTHTHNRF